MKKRILLACLIGTSAFHSINAMEFNPLIDRQSGWTDCGTLYTEMYGAQKATIHVTLGSFDNSGDFEALTGEDFILISSKDSEEIDLVLEPVASETPNIYHMVPSKTTVVWPRQLDVNGHLIKKQYENLHDSDIILDAGPTPEGFSVGNSLQCFYWCRNKTANPTDVMISATIEGKETIDTYFVYGQFIQGTIKITSENNQTKVNFYDRDASLLSFK